ncbi:MAG TPA: hypothetical protein GXZ85_02595 [Firmicutes bacterium]|jgi:hypothetical protein|nr:hypothetical protein [Bacillota bacterium]
MLINRLDPSFVQSSLELLGKACEGHPHLRVKIAVDCVQKGYATHEQVADFLGLSVDRWRSFYEHFQEGDVARIPNKLRNVVPAIDLRLLTGFTDDQLNILERALEVPILMAEGVDEHHPLLQELRFLMVFGVLLKGKHDRFKSYSLRIAW